MEKPPFNIEQLEDRKRKEIEHSKIRRTILRGSERRSDTNKSEEPANLESMIRDREAFKYHFSNVKFYSITNSSETYQHEWVKRKCRQGVRILDFACGNGENGIYAAQCGAECVGIDISAEGVANANLNAVEAKVDDHCFFRVMDGENMAFANDSFDLAIEYGALHHVDFERAMGELSRVLKPEGEMMCIEALRHNPFIHWYRKRTPHLRTAWEVDHILTVDHLEIARRYFSDVEAKFFHLAVLASVPLRKTPIFGLVRNLLERVDKMLLRGPRLGKYAWIMIFTVGRPKK